MQKNNKAFASVLYFLVFTLHSLQADWSGKDYEESNVAQFAYALNEMHKLSCKESESMLDIGCGDGKVTRYIAQKYLSNGHIHGIDNAESMIQLAQSYKGYPNTSFEYADICTYESAMQYDIVVSFWCLHWVNDYGQALKNIADLLKPGGKTLLCHIADYHTHPLLSCMQRVLKQAEWQEFILEGAQMFNSPPLEQVVEAVRRSGLSIEHIEIKKNCQWIPLQTLKQNLLSTSLFDCVIKEKRTELCSQVIQEYIAENPLNEAGEFYQWLPVVVLVLKK